ncbi:hypothetical protein [Paludisphaera mucosa]|uniref:DUF3106 domain-containing protein n=1 Tax=Paludisphaera mucosa TaxID=3030827 RepID=A0ABT6F5W9_9BACT|nr:hypothetical protein [Paludisphaera mucosa]MDG3002909.1 hypothetical protein [Paludisphaera mucosa]
MIGAAHDSPLHLRSIALAIGLAVVVIAGAATLEGNRAGFLAKSAAERDLLRETLRRFDMRLNSNEQSLVRSLDERLNALPDEERDEYLTVLRRYHNWLRQLPERVRDDLVGGPVEGRLKRIQDLAAKYPPPKEEARSSLDFVQIGGTGAFELAALCKVWMALPPAERKQIDGLPVGSRKDELVKRGRELKIPRELRPDDFDEARWTAEAEARIRELRSQSAGPRDWVSKIEGKLEQSEANAPEGVPRVRRFLRRLAVNLYVDEHKPGHPVEPSRLAQFFEATPTWIQSTFGSFTADEVRRRVSVVYRTLYPFPEEFRGVLPGPAPSAAKPSPSVPAAKPATPPKPAGNQAPF